MMQLIETHGWLTEKPRSAIQLRALQNAFRCRDVHLQRRVSALAASVRPHHTSDSGRRDGKAMATIRGKKIGCYNNRILTRRLS